MPTGTISAGETVGIFLVCDQPNRLQNYRSILSPLGHDISCASSGVEAARQLRNREFAVVLVDMGMTDPEGAETAELIERQLRHAHTSIVVVLDERDTIAHWQVNERTRAIDCLSSPVAPEIILGKVAALAGLHARCNRLQQLNAELAQENGRHQLELAHAEACKDEFLAILSHELRNPLAPIRYAVELLSRSAADLAALEWSREVIGRQVAFLSALADNLLDISRTTRGAIDLHTQRLGVEANVDDATRPGEPVSIARSAMPRRRESPGDTPRAMRRRVLVVDDNVDALEGLSLLLEMAGNEVIKASDGIEAIEVAAARPPDLAVLDLGMPRMDGYELARRIRAEPWGLHLPLVALSGWGQSDDRRRARESGFDCHLVKPVSFDAVADVMARLAPDSVA